MKAMLNSKFMILTYDPDIYPAFITALHWIDTLQRHHEKQSSFSALNQKIIETQIYPQVANLADEMLTQTIVKAGSAKDTFVAIDTTNSLFRDIVRYWCAWLSLEVGDSSKTFDYLNEIEDLPNILSLQYIPSNGREIPHGIKNLPLFKPEKLVPWLLQLPDLAFKTVYDRFWVSCQFAVLTEEVGIVNTASLFQLPQRQHPRINELKRKIAALVRPAVATTTLSAAAQPLQTVDTAVASTTDAAKDDATTKAMPPNPTASTFPRLLQMAIAACNFNVISTQDWDNFDNATLIRLLEQHPESFLALSKQDNVINRFTLDARAAYVFLWAGAKCQCHESRYAVIDWLNNQVNPQTHQILDVLCVEDILRLLNLALEHQDAAVDVAAGATMQAQTMLDTRVSSSASSSAQVENPRATESQAQPHPLVEHLLHSKIITQTILKNNEQVYALRNQFPAAFNTLLSIAKPAILNTITQTSIFSALAYKGISDANIKRIFELSTCHLTIDEMVRFINNIGDVACEYFDLIIEHMKKNPNIPFDNLYRSYNLSWDKIVDQLLNPIKQIKTLAPKCYLKLLCYFAKQFHNANSLYVVRFESFLKSLLADEDYESFCQVCFTIPSTLHSNATKDLLFRANEALYQHARQQYSILRDTDNTMANQYLSICHCISDIFRDKIESRINDKNIETQQKTTTALCQHFKIKPAFLVKTLYDRFTHNKQTKLFFKTNNCPYFKLLTQLAESNAEANDALAKYYLECHFSQPQATPTIMVHFFNRLTKCISFQFNEYLSSSKTEAYTPAESLAIKQDMLMRCQNLIERATQPHELLYKFLGFMLFGIIVACYTRDESTENLPRPLDIDIATITTAKPYQQLVSADVSTIAAFIEAFDKCMTYINRNDIPPAAKLWFTETLSPLHQQLSSELNDHDLGNIGASTIDTLFGVKP